ncbi:MAG: orotidine-5'-phosphate decarboxylase [Coxiellaceae bacterium]|nr:orotidine-5'-phosphate decarboxylase [Coxiellaceae bacterium]
MSLARLPIIIALDQDTDSQVMSFVRQLSPSQCRLKVGKYLFVRYGAHLIEQLMSLGFEIFLDLKFHDIPHTVRQACQAAAELGVWMLNVHCQGGEAMLHAAVEGVNRAASSQRPLLVGVTLLTSLRAQDLHALKFEASVDELVCHYAKMAEQAGLDGVVCSAQEAQRLRQQCSESFTLVTPGIRLLPSDSDDQHRIQTPQQALSNGADYLVIGRPITQSLDPLAQLTALSMVVAQPT